MYATCAVMRAVAIVMVLIASTGLVSVSAQTVLAALAAKFPQQYSLAISAISDASVVGADAVAYLNAKKGMRIACTYVFV